MLAPMEDVVFLVVTLAVAAVVTLSLLMWGRQPNTAA
jgi:hypothetical protein